MRRKLLYVLVVATVCLAAALMLINRSKATALVGGESPAIVGRYQVTHTTDEEGGWIILDTATGRWEHYTPGTRLYVIEGRFGGDYYDWRYVSRGKQN